MEAYRFVDVGDIKSARTVEAIVPFWVTVMQALHTPFLTLRLYIRPPTPKGDFVKRETGKRQMIIDYFVVFLLFILALVEFLRVDSFSFWITFTCNLIAFEADEWLIQRDVAVSHTSAMR